MVVETPQSQELVDALAAQLAPAGYAWLDEVSDTAIDEMPPGTIAVVGEATEVGAEFVTSVVTMTLDLMAIVPGGLREARVLRDALQRLVMDDRSLGGLADECSITASSLNPLDIEGSYVTVAVFVVVVRFIARGA